MWSLLYDFCRCTSHSDLQNYVVSDFLMCCSKPVLLFFFLPLYVPVVPVVTPLYHGCQESSGVQLLGGAWTSTGPSGDIQGGESHQLSWQVHPGTLWRKPCVHAQQRAARPA